MAGHGCVKHDPAIERWSNMREDAYKHFRFTPRTTIQAIVGVILFPGALFYYFSRDNSKWDWAGKLKHESLLRVPPSSSKSV